MLVSAHPELSGQLPRLTKKGESSLCEVWSYFDPSVGSIFTPLALPEIDTEFAFSIIFL